MKVKTLQATGLQLDYGLAKACNALVDEEFSPYVRIRQDREWFTFSHLDPKICMGLIKAHSLNVEHGRSEFGLCYAVVYDSYGCLWSRSSGYSVEEAVARCVISLKLGDEFEMPDQREPCNHTLRLDSVAGIK